MFGPGQKLHCHQPNPTEEMDSEKKDKAKLGEFDSWTLGPTEYPVQGRSVLEGQGQDVEVEREEQAKREA